MVRSLLGLCGFLVGLIGALGLSVVKKSRGRVVFLSANGFGYLVRLGVGLSVVIGLPKESSNSILTVRLATVGTSQVLRPFRPVSGCRMRTTSRSTAGSGKEASPR